MDATALSLEAQLNNERQRCAALEAAQRDLEAACQEALDDAKRSDEALHEARTDLELCKLDLEAAQLEVDERAHADQAKIDQLEAQLRDAQTSATAEERTTLKARVEELEAELLKITMFGRTSKVWEARVARRPGPGAPAG